MDVGFRVSRGCCPDLGTRYENKTHGMTICLTPCPPSFSNLLPGLLSSHCTYSTCVIRILTHILPNVVQALQPSSSRAQAVHLLFLARSRAFILGVLDDQALTPSNSPTPSLSRSLLLSPSHKLIEDHRYPARTSDFVPPSHPSSLFSQGPNHAGGRCYSHQ